MDLARSQLPCKKAADTIEHVNNLYTVLYGIVRYINSRNIVLHHFCIIYDFMTFAKSCCVADTETKHRTGRVAQSSETDDCIGYAPPTCNPISL